MCREQHCRLLNMIVNTCVSISLFAVGMDGDVNFSCLVEVAEKCYSDVWSVIRRIQSRLFFRSKNGAGKEGFLASRPTTPHHALKIYFLIFQTLLGLLVGWKHAAGVVSVRNLQGFCVKIPKTRQAVF
jgi:hypothetical protein